MKKHSLYLSMYIFQIKKNNTSDKKTISPNKFMALAYPNCKNAFLEGFTEDLVKSIEKKAYTNTKGTHGGILEKKKIRGNLRMIDIIINGGITGIKQLIIEEDGKKRELSEKEIVGMKFYFRVWLPSNGQLGYVFTQSYSSLSVKPLFDDIIETVLKNHGYRFAGGKMLRTTTKKRQNEFLKKSRLKDIIVLTQKNANSTSFADADLLQLTLKNVSLSGNKDLDFEEIAKISQRHGILLKGKNFILKGKYELPHNNKKEEKTVSLKHDNETINVIPNVDIPFYCIDNDNYPDFEQMVNFVDSEINQIKKEIKK